MKITDKEIDRIASLAKLEFKDDEKQEIRDDMNKILTFIEKLNELDTDNVEPLLFMNDEVNTLRPDEARIDITQKEALKNAPQKDSDYIKIPKVLNK